MSLSAAPACTRQSARMRRVAAPLLALGVLLLAAGPATAHVTVNPGTVETGGFAELTFRAPNEQDDASTTKIEVTFPDNQPLAFVSVRPVPGWTVAVEKTKLATPISSDDGDVTEAVSKITWSGGKINPGEYQNFDVSVGPLPDKPTTLVFRALQTYSNGEIVRWIEPTTPGGEDPDHPAPVLTVAAPAAATRPSPSAAPTATATEETATTSTSSDSGLWLGLAGLLVAVAALAVAFLTRRTRSEVDTPTKAADKAGV